MRGTAIMVGGVTLFALMRAGTVDAGPCPITGFYTDCYAATVASNCAAISPQSWPAAEPIRIAVSCTDIACPVPLPWCNVPASCIRTPNPEAYPNMWHIRRGARAVDGNFVITNTTCPGYTAVLEYDRLLEPRDDYFLITADYDYFQIALIGTLPPSATPTSTATPSPTSTPSPTATQTSPPCVGDCNDDGMVRIEELITGLHILQGQVLASSCRALDCQAGESIPSMNCLITAVGNALTGCTSQPHH